MMRCLVCLCVFFKQIVCKDVRLELQNLSMTTLRNVLGCTQGPHGMGLIVSTIQQVLFWLQQEWD